MEVHPLLIGLDDVAPEEKVVVIHHTAGEVGLEQEEVSDKTCINYAPHTMNDKIECKYRGLQQSLHIIKKLSS